MTVNGLMIMFQCARAFHIRCEMKHSPKSFLMAIPTRQQHITLPLRNSQLTVLFSSSDTMDFLSLVSKTSSEIYSARYHRKGILGKILKHTFQIRHL
jgi:hypothetical protein